MFVEEVGPVVRTGDAGALLRHVTAFWPNQRLVGLLGCGHSDAARLAAACLAMSGTMEDCRELGAAMRGDDEPLAVMAEHALWSIWLRSGEPEANAVLRRAVRAMGENRIDAAIDILTDLVQLCPKFAEAYNQRAIAMFLRGRYAESAEDCRRALQHNPLHFGAMASLGHSLTAMGYYGRASAAYRASLRLNPRCQAVRQAMRDIGRLLAPQGEAVNEPL